MIVQLTGTLVEKDAGSVVLDVAGVGYELGVSYTTLTRLPQAGAKDVMLYVRMRVKDDGITLFGFSTKEERKLFDKLCSISSVGPKVALSVLSSLTPAQLAEVVATKDLTRMTSVPGVGKKTASRLLLELEGLFAKDAELKSMAARTGSLDFSASPAAFLTEATEALLSMGFTSQEAELALTDYDKHNVSTVEQALQYALRRMGGGK